MFSGTYSNDLVPDALFDRSFSRGLGWHCVGIGGIIVPSIRCHLLRVEVHAGIQIICLPVANKAFRFDFFVTTEFCTGDLHSAHKEIEVTMFHAFGTFTDNIDVLTESIGVMPHRIFQVVASAIAWSVYGIIVLLPKITAAGAKKNCRSAD